MLSFTSQASAQAPTGAAAFNIPTLVEGQRFDAAAVVDAARALAQRPLIPLVATDLPDGYSTMPADQYAGIRLQSGATIWAGENRGFTVEPLHRGYVFSNPVSLFTIEDGTRSQDRLRPGQVRLWPRDAAGGECGSAVLRHAHRSRA